MEIRNEVLVLRGYSLVIMTSHWSILEDVSDRGDLALFDNHTLIGMPLGDIRRPRLESFSNLSFTWKVMGKTSRCIEGIYVLIFQLKCAEAVWTFQETVQNPCNSISTRQVEFNNAGLERNLVD